MFTHDDIWRALDQLARSLSTSPSGLARKAGLDPTAFNPSKRQTADGKLRWPSTESLSKVLNVAGMSLEEFSRLGQAGDKAPMRSTIPSVPSRPVPVIGLAEAGSDGYFDDAGFPLGSGWDEVQIPGGTDKALYALEIHGDSMQPVFRPGDRIIVSPYETIRRGDRVVVKTLDGEVMAKELVRQTARRVELRSLNQDFEDRTFHQRDIIWIARIIWVSQ